jgi:hypothetical protein
VDFIVKIGSFLTVLFNVSHIKSKTHTQNLVSERLIFVRMLCLLHKTCLQFFFGLFFPQSCKSTGFANPCGDLWSKNFSLVSHFLNMNSHDFYCASKVGALVELKLQLLQFIIASYRESKQTFFGQKSHK